MSLEITLTTFDLLHIDPITNWLIEHNISYVFKENTIIFETISDKIHYKLYWDEKLPELNKHLLGELFGNSSKTGPRIYSDVMLDILKNIK